MTWPTSQTTNSLDADSDTLQNARHEVKGLADKFNLLVAHVTGFMQGLLTSTDAAAARTALDVPARNGAGASGNWPINAQGLSATLSVAGGGTGATTAAAAFAAIKQQASEAATGVVELATAAEAQAGVDAARVLTPSGLKSAQIQLGTAVTASGTAVDFSGVPSWAKRVKVHFSGLSTNAASPLRLHLGTASGMEFSGYVSKGSTFVSSASSGNFEDTAGFLVGGAATAASTYHGCIQLDLMGSSTWACSGSVARGNELRYDILSGSKQLAGVLTQVRVTTVSGVGVFDAGLVNISWE